MKKMLAVLLPLALCASAVFAFDHGDSVVHWKGIAGVISAQNVDNVVGDPDHPNPTTDIHSGTFAWTARRGRASVNLSTGDTSFDVEGLVINGTKFSGTAGPVSAVTGTLVCNANTQTQTISDTAPVSISADGDARFSGQIADVPASCGNPLFLIRIFTPAGAKGAWIATGTQRSFGDDE
jgi:hypothetical protein